MGRKVEDPRTGFVKIRVSENDRKIIDFCANALKMNRSDVIREGIRVIYDRLGGGVKNE